MTVRGGSVAALAAALLVSSPSPTSLPAGRPLAATLPAPTGSHVVGTTLFRWVDSTRNASGEGRLLRVRVWYPASATEGPTAPYVFDLAALRQALGRDYAAALEGVRPHARLNPPPVRSEIPFPVVVFSHGLGSLPALYTSLAEDLASHGYVVFAPSHPGGARATLDRNGRPVLRDPAWSEPGTHEALFRKTVETWSDDERFVIRRLRRLALEDGQGGSIGDLIDANRIVTAGHSLGASSALLTGQRDSAVRAVVSLEGTVRRVHLDETVSTPLLMMEKDPDLVRRKAAARSLGLDEAGLDRFLTRLRVQGEHLRARAEFCVPHVQIERAHHNHFGDQSIVFGEPAGMGPLVEETRAVEIVRTHVRTFLDRSVGRRSGGLDELRRSMPEARRRDACPPDEPAQSGVRDLPDVRLFTASFGSGEPLMVVHGGPSIGHEYLLPWMLPLARNRRLVFYDQRGIGRSPAEADSARLNLETNIVDLDALRASYGFERVDLIGHSYGAGLAASYAVRYPHRVRSLILLAPLPAQPEAQRRLRDNLESRRASPDSAHLAFLFGSRGFEVGDREIVDRVYEFTYRPWFANPGKAAHLSFGLDRGAAERGRRVGRLVTGDSDGYHPWPGTDQLRVPTLVVHGARDPVPAEDVRALAGRFPNGRFVLLPRSGHFPFIETPDTLFSTIDSFLDAR